MIVTGTLLGAFGVAIAHFCMKYFAEYYLILVFPILIGILFLGTGLSWGARIGRCCRFNVIVFLLVLIFSVMSYGSLLFLNHYYDSFEEPPEIVLDEVFALKNDTQNFLAELPFISDYISPVEQESPREHIGTQITEFVKALPEQAFNQESIVVGSIFDLALLAPVKDYLVYPGITQWDDENGRLVFDEVLVRPWMVWAGELFFLWLITLLKTRKGIKKARIKRQKRLKKRGLGQQRMQLTVTPSHDVAEPEPKPKKEKRSLFGRKKKPAPVVEEVVAEKAPEEDTKEEKKKEKKKKRGWFKRKSKEPAEVETGETPEAAKEAELDFQLEEDEEEKRFALILHQYDSSRQIDLVRLIQQVSQVPEDRAQRLLKVPSLLKRDITMQEARIATDKFHQVQAQVKLITMEQLAEIQTKQQRTAQPNASPSPRPTAPPSGGKAGGNAGERYALILRKFDPSQRRPVLELLSSLSNTPVAQLQQTLKTPALVLRGASKDEVMMIAQQFQTIQADVKMLSMAELQKLMSKK